MSFDPVAIGTMAADYLVHSTVCTNHRADLIEVMTFAERVKQKFGEVVAIRFTDTVNLHLKTFQPPKSCDHDMYLTFRRTFQYFASQVD